MITLNDLLLIIVWVVGIGGAIAAGLMARKQVRASAQLILDQASFAAATQVVDLLRDQVQELRAELDAVRGEVRALRAREGKLLNRIRMLEATLIQNGVGVPQNGVD
jgi:ribosomal protein S13